jgi:hypothetical protein
MGSSTDADHEWQSGDWREPPNQEPPYNGIQLRAVPARNGQGMLTSLELVFADFTNKRDGVAMSYSATPQDGESIHLSAKGDFTISGFVKIRSLASVPDRVVVYFQSVYYGLEQRRHHVAGGVLTVPRKLPPTAAILETSEATTASEAPAPEEHPSEGDDPADSKAEAAPPRKSGTRKGPRR